MRRVAFGVLLALLAPSLGGAAPPQVDPLQVDDLCPPFVLPGETSVIFIAGSGLTGAVVTIDGNAPNVLASTASTCLVECAPLSPGNHTLAVSQGVETISLSLVARERTPSDCLALFDCLLNVVAASRRSNLITSDGTLTSLSAKLQAGRIAFVDRAFKVAANHVRSFAAEVEAQSGGMIDPALATFLSRLALEELVPCICEALTVCPRPEFKEEFEFTVEVANKQGTRGKRKVVRTLDVKDKEAKVTFKPGAPGDETKTLGEFTLELRLEDENKELCICWFCYFPKKDDNTKHELNITLTDLDKNLPAGKGVEFCGTVFLWIACKFEPKTEEEKAKCCKEYTWVQLIKQTATGFTEGVVQEAKGKKPEIKDQFTFSDFRVDKGPCTFLTSPDGYPKSCLATPSAEQAIAFLPKAKEKHGQVCRLFFDYPSDVADVGTDAPDVDHTLIQEFQTYLVCTSPSFVALAQANWGHKVTLKVASGVPTCAITDRHKEGVSPPDLTEYKKALKPYLEAFPDSDKSKPKWGVE